jgi:hypothetical protein
MNIEQALKKHEQRLMSMPGVEGVGITGTSDSPAILVMVRQGATAIARQLPSRLEGYPVKVETTGEISAF